MAKTLVTLVFDDETHAADLVKALAQERLHIRSEFTTNYNMVEAEVTLPYMGFTWDAIKNG